jgi:hypothetical protein
MVGLQKKNSPILVPSYSANYARTSTVKNITVYFIYIYIWTYAQINSVDLYSVTPKYFSINTPSSGGLKVVLAKVMNYSNKIKYNSVLLWHIAFYHFNES